MVGAEPFIAVYMMANRRHGTLYIGVTSDLITRAVQHRDGALDGFTTRYELHRLVWYETHDFMTEAIKREKGAEEVQARMEDQPIERENFEWNDLFPALLAPPGPVQTHWPHDPT